MDKELRKRGHRFVRYADDCTIYVKSEKSAKRTAESTIRYIEKELKLKVNRDKTRIGQANQSSLLGYSFYNDKGKWEPIINDKSRKRLKAKIKEITQRSNGQSIKGQIKKLQMLIPGWINYFILAKGKTVLMRMDGLVRTRLRMVTWKHWKRPRTRVRNLIKLGVERVQSIRWGSSSKGYCRVANSWILSCTLDNAYWRKQGYKGFVETYKEKKIQTSLF